MIFSQTWQLILDGKKTQTRRLCTDQDSPAYKFPGHKLLRVVQAYRNHRLLYEVGRTYAVQSGRGEKAVGRVRLIDIRREHLQYISRDDAFAEGIGDPSYDDEISGICLGDIAGGCGACANCEPVWHFSRLWDSIHTKLGTRWEDNPEVWVLTFELVEEGGKDVQV